MRTHHEVDDKPGELLHPDIDLDNRSNTLSIASSAFALIDGIIPALEPAAKSIADGELQINALFQSEINARKTVVDTLWEQRKVVETILGRSGKILARFVFFDFRKQNDSDPLATPPNTPPTP